MALRVIGVLMLGTGVVLTAIAFISFFSAFSGHSFGPPKGFFLAFIGLPLMGIGGAICKFAFMGSVARYAAGELAPVGRDTFNYMARGTRPGVRNLTSAAREGWHGAPAADRDKGTVRERLAKLESLRAEGLIDAEDFEEQKDRILNDL